MGYCVDITESTFSFNKSKENEIMECIKDFTKSYKKDYNG